MYKQSHIIKNWSIIFHTNHGIDTVGWYIIPTLVLFNVRGNGKYSYSHSFKIGIDWLMMSIQLVKRPKIK